MKIDELMAQGKAYTLTGEQLNGLPGIYQGAISQEADFAGKLWVGMNVQIGDASIGDACFINNGVEIEDNATIRDNVKLSGGVTLRQSTYIGSRSMIGYMSDIHERTIIGHYTEIPADAKVGSDLVIPDFKSIVCLGKFGTAKRVITIHGSDSGPRFSIGCQVSVDWSTIYDRIQNNTATTEESAVHYKNYLDAFNAIGKQTQQHYDKQSSLVRELREEANYSRTNG